MADYTPLYGGAINQAADKDAIWLKVFGGEILATFSRANKMMPRTLVRTIMSGKSAQFPRIGTASGGYHTPGTAIEGRESNNAEIVITIDDLLISDQFFSNIDEAKAHYDFRAPYAQEMGIFLANQMDQHLIIEGLKGARLTSVGTELPTGTNVNGSLSWISNNSFLLTSEQSGTGASTVVAKAAAWVTATKAAKVRFAQNNIPEEGRFLVLREQEYCDILEGGVGAGGLSVVNKDVTGNTVNGSIADGKVYKLNGFELVSTEALPKTDLGSTGLNEFHGGDYSATVGLFGQTNAIGTVKLMDMAMESETTVRHQGTLVVAKYAVGHKYLRPESLIELKLASGTVTT